MQGLFATHCLWVLADLSTSSQLVLVLVVVSIFAGAVAAIVLVGRRARASEPPPGSTRLLGSALAQYEHLVSIGQMVPLPEVIPMAPRLVQTSGRVPEVLRWAEELRAIPWGAAPTVREVELRDLFSSTLGQVFGVRADFARYENLLQVFASMPAPYCYVGAAEIMRRMSFFVGRIYVPEGLLQALLFATQAQCASPLQPDALVAQARILSSLRHPEWDRLAGQTFALLDRVAPQHPRLPAARCVYFQIHVKPNEALACANAAVAQAPTVSERADAYKQMADILRDLRRYPEALQAYDLSLGCDPLNEWVWHNKSLTLLDAGMVEEAYVCNQRALSLQQFGAALEVKKRILSALQQRNLKPPQPVSWL